MLHGGEKQRELIVMPQELQKPCVEWYHEQLLHPRITRTEGAIRQHFYWENLREDIRKHCRKCHKCQRTKRKTIAYGILQRKKQKQLQEDDRIFYWLRQFTLRRTKF